MKRTVKKTLISFVCFLLLTFTVSAESIPTQKNYTYSNSGESINAPQSYELLATIFDFGNPFSEIADVQVLNDKVYVLDSERGEIFVINRDYRIEKVFGSKFELNQPQGFFVSEQGYIYIADTKNGRIVKSDVNGNMICTVNKPKNYKTISTVKFEPTKIVVDKGERLYVVVADETNGIYQMNIHGDFLGFFGSVPVVPSLTELFWRRFSTKEQLSRMLLFVPTEYSSIDIDDNGFIYTTVSTNSAEQIASYIASGGPDSLAPIRKLNPKNVDVLKRTGSMPPAGDTVDENASRFIDISIRNDGIYSALDSTNSRVFTYSQEGELLFIFGNENTKKDGLHSPCALCWWDNDIVVADKGNNAIKVFSPTKYANTVCSAIESENKGDYSAAGKAYRQLLDMHPGNGIAYLGIGKQKMRDGDYRAAMDYFKKAERKSYYSKALKLRRNEVGYTYIGIVVAGIILICIISFLVRKYKRKTGKKSKISDNPTFRAVLYGKYIMSHPFDGFENMQREGGCSVKSASIVLGILVIFSVLSSVATGYMISGITKITQSVMVKGVLGVLLPFFLWCVANWSVTSLMNGSGTFKKIYIYSCYSLLPIVIIMPFLVVFSHFVSADEVALYQIISTIFYIWAGFMLFCGTLVIHQYSPSRTIITILFIVVAMGIIVFLLLLCITILQQITEFLKLLFEEIRLRL